MIKKVLSKIMDMEISKQNAESANLLSLIKIGGMRSNNLSFKFSNKVTKKYKEARICFIQIKAVSHSQFFPSGIILKIINGLRAKIK